MRRVLLRLLCSRLPRGVFWILLLLPPCWRGAVIPCETMGNNFTTVEFLLVQSEILQLATALAYFPSPAKVSTDPSKLLLEVSQQHLPHLLAVCMGWLVEVRTRRLLQKSA